MATYYVRQTGSDAAAGTSAGAAWLTIGKALGASGIASGDTVYIGAGVYRETVSVAMAAAAAETKVIGDIDGAQTGDAGEVIWSAYRTNDKTAPASTVTLSLNAKPFLTFQYLTFMGGNANPSCVSAGTTAVSIKFLDCAFYIYPTQLVAMQLTSTAGAALTWTIDRCRFTGALFVTAARSGSDYDMAIIVRNSIFLCSGDCLRLTSGSAGAGFGGGLLVQYCTLFSPSACVRANDASLSTTIPCIVTGCLLLGIGGLNANTSGEITESYNAFLCNTPTRTNVTAGTGSIVNTYAPLFNLGQEQVIGATLRPFFAPKAGSPLLAFSSAASPPVVDSLNRPRPAGGGSPLPAVGAFERGNTWGKETGTVRTGSNALSVVGPAYQDFDVPVSAAATTVSVYMRYDSTYAGTKPSLNIVNGTECGVANASATQVGAANTWESLSLTFTPTAAGIVTVRLLSSDTDGAGKAFADDVTVA